MQMLFSLSFQSWFCLYNESDAECPEFYSNHVNLSQFSSFELTNEPFDDPRDVEIFVCPDFVKMNLSRVALDHQAQVIYLSGESQSQNIEILISSPMVQTLISLSLCNLNVSFNLTMKNPSVNNIYLQNTSITATPSYRSLKVYGILHCDVNSADFSPGLAPTIFELDIQNTTIGEHNINYNALTSFYIITEKNLPLDFTLHSNFDMTCKTPYCTIDITFQYKASDGFTLIKLIGEDTTFRVHGNISTMVDRPMFSMNVTFYGGHSKAIFDGDWYDSTYVFEAQNTESAEIFTALNTSFAIAGMKSNVTVYLPDNAVSSELSQVYMSESSVTIKCNNDIRNYNLSIPFISINTYGDLITDPAIHVTTESIDWTGNDNARPSHLYGGVYEILNRIRFYSFYPIFEHLILRDGVVIDADFQIIDSGFLNITKSLSCQNLKFVLYFSAPFAVIKNSDFSKFIDGKLSPLIAYPQSSQTGNFSLGIDDTYDNHIGFTNSTSIIAPNYDYLDSTIKRFGFSIPVLPNDVYKTICIGVDDSSCPKDSDFQTINSIDFLKFENTSRQISFYIKDPVEPFSLNLSTIRQSKSISIYSNPSISPQNVTVFLDNSRIVSGLKITNINMYMQVVDQITLFLDTMSVGVNCTNIKGMQDHVILKVASIDMHYTMMPIFNLEDHKDVSINLGRELSAVYIGNYDVNFTINNEPIKRPSAPRSVVAYQTSTSYLSYAPYNADTVHMSNVVDLVWNPQVIPTLDIKGAWVTESPQNLHIMSLEAVVIKVSTSVIPVAFDGLTSIDLVADNKIEALFTGSVTMTKSMTIHTNDNITNVRFNHVKMAGVFTTFDLELNSAIDNVIIDRLEILTGAKVHITKATIKKNIIIHDQSSAEFEQVDMGEATMNFRMQVGCPDVTAAFYYLSVPPKSIIVSPLRSACGNNQDPGNSTAKLVCYLDEEACQALAGKVTFSPSSVFWGVDKQVHFDVTCADQGQYKCLTVLFNESRMEVDQTFMSDGDVALVAVPSVIFFLGFVAIVIALVFYLKSDNGPRDDLDEDEKYYYFNQKLGEE